MTSIAKGNVGTVIVAVIGIVTGMYIQDNLDHPKKKTVHSGGFSGFTRITSPPVASTKIYPSVVMLHHEGGHHSDPPPDWKLETDGKQWRWVKPDGETCLPLDSREEAIDNAWKFYDYREPNWRSAK